MDLECRGGRVRFSGSVVEVGGGCVEFCRRAVEVLAGLSRRVFHTPDAWVFVTDSGMASVEERLFVDSCRVSGPVDVVERVLDALGLR